MEESKREASGEGEKDIKPSAIHDSCFTVLLASASSGFSSRCLSSPGIIPLADVIFEHRVYLPSVGAFMAVTSAVLLTYKRLGNDRIRMIAIGLRLSFWCFFPWLLFAEFCMGKQLELVE